MVFRVFLFSLVWLTSPMMAEAFCINNGTNVTLHSQSLDSHTFEHDIPAGKKVCCSQCSATQKAAIVMIVSGYVPVSGNRHPGWQAECRVKVPPGKQVLVTGDLQHLSCRTQPDQ